MTEPSTEGGEFLRRALLKDVVHPKTGHDPQTDAADADPGPVRATDHSQALGADTNVRSPREQAMKEFRDYLTGTLDRGRRLR